MPQVTHSEFGFRAWRLVDSALPNVFKRGKYPGVFPPISVTLRLNTVLEPHSNRLFDANAIPDEVIFVEHRAALRHAADHAPFNMSKLTPRCPHSRRNQLKLPSDFEGCACDVSARVRDIIGNFRFRAQLQAKPKREAIDIISIERDAEGQLDGSTKQGEK